MSSTDTEFRRNTRFAYSKNAELYDDYRLRDPRGKLLSEHDVALFVKMLPEHWTNKTVLEVGSGTGRFTLPMLKRGLRVIATDINEEMLNVLREKLENNHPPLQCKVATEDVFHLSFHDNQFECVVSIHLVPRFTVLTDQADAIKSISRIMKPGGQFLFNFRNSKSPYHFLKGGHAVSLKQMTHVLDGVGLQILAIRGKWIATRQLLNWLPMWFGKWVISWDRYLWSFQSGGAWDVFVLAEKGEACQTLVETNS